MREGFKSVSLWNYWLLIVAVWAKCWAGSLSAMLQTLINCLFSIEYFPIYALERNSNVVQWIRQNKQTKPRAQITMIVLQNYFRNKSSSVGAIKGLGGVVEVTNIKIHYMPVWHCQNISKNKHWISTWSYTTFLSIIWYKQTLGPLFYPISIHKLKTSSGSESHFLEVFVSFELKEIML